MKTFVVFYVLLSKGWMPFISIPVENEDQCYQVSQTHSTSHIYKIGKDEWDFKGMQVKFTCEKR